MNPENPQDPDALDGFDLKLLACLQEDGRLTNAEIGDRIGLSASQCSRRRIRLEESGIIEGYQARLNAERLGFGLIALIQVTLVRHSRENSRQFQAFVAGIDQIQSAYALTGDTDYLIKIAVRSLSDLTRIINDTILDHPIVSNVRSSIVLEKLKDVNSLPLAVRHR
jgi:DNA-binding Lrp family transcriptional regulator